MNDEVIQALEDAEQYEIMYPRHRPGVFALACKMALDVVREGAKAGLNRGKQATRYGSRKIDGGSGTRS